jgi:drug/metabolite transporter (DMT)-like permease
MMRRSGRDLHPSVITSGQMIAGLVPLMTYALTVEGNPLEIRWTRTALVAVAYLAVMGSVLAAWLNYWLLARVGAVNLLVMGLVEPPIAIVLGAWLLGERLQSRTLAGSAMILASVWLAMAPAKRTR